TAEQGGQAATLGTVQQYQEHDQDTGHDQDDLQGQLHGRKTTWWRCPPCSGGYGSGPPAAIADSVANCSPSRDAPPTSAPSTSPCETISPTFFAFTEPP